jgi:hypothetical protein
LHEVVQRQPPAPTPFHEKPVQRIKHAGASWLARCSLLLLVLLGAAVLAAGTASAAVWPVAAAAIIAAAAAFSTAAVTVAGDAALSAGSLGRLQGLLMLQPGRRRPQVCQQRGLPQGSHGNLIILQVGQAPGGWEESGAADIPAARVCRERSL